MRIILQCHPRTHIADKLSNLKWFGIKQRIIFLTVVLVFKIMHSKTPNYMSHWLVPVSHQYGTRRSTSRYLFVPRSHPNSLTSLPKALDSGISYQHPFELSQTSRHSKKPQLSSLHIISTSTNQHYTSHIHMVSLHIPYPTI